MWEEKIKMQKKEIKREKENQKHLRKMRLRKYRIKKKAGVTQTSD